MIRTSAQESCDFNKVKMKRRNYDLSGCLKGQRSKTCPRDSLSRLMNDYLLAKVQLKIIKMNKNIILNTLFFQRSEGQVFDLFSKCYNHRNNNEDVIEIWRKEENKK